MAQSSSSRTQGISASALSFVFTLCLPYASATPVPSSGQVSGGSAAALSRSDMVKTGLGTVRRISRRLLAEAGIVTTTSSAGLTVPPRIVEFARVSSEGYYRVPDNYVILVQEFNPGFIVLSCAIAFVGSLCTLELLIRRTTNAGWRNQVLLASAGFTFGAVSTFAMHFIFNNSLSLHHPLQHGKNHPSLRLAYNPGFTILSLVASCLAMTLAFFIMGTTLSDWWCIPGARRRRRRRGSSVSMSENQKHKDEYGTWKESHKNVIRRGTVGIGALLQRAGSVAKWSMMDIGSSEEERVNTKWNSSKRDGKWSTPLSPEDHLIRHDKKLEELDFRLGRSAVKLELAKRADPGMPVTPVTPVDYGYSRRSVSSIRPMASDASLPQEPIKAMYPPHRRGSVPTLEHANDSEVFSPGFNFPMKTEDPISSTTQLVPLSAPSTARTIERSPLDWPSAEMTPEPFHDPTKRRASLPAVSYTVARTESAFRPTHTLSRIQSLPEADPELGPSGSRSGSYDKQMSQESGMSDNTKLEPIILDRPASSHNRHVEFKKKPAFTAIERFLGFDVVTREEIIKIFITGTLAGMGVCSMHYIGQLSIIDMPYIAYKAPYVIGSVVIASGAVVIALYIMFIMLRPKLKHTWLSKIAVAVVLSIAVVGMHFTGMRGTIYAWPTGGGIRPSELLTGTNRAITGIVAALAFLACIACAVFFVLHSIKLRRERARRRRVVVAAVFLDQYDRVLVNSTDGMLPMCDIAQLTGGETNSSKRSLKSNTNSFNSDSTVLGMDLTTGHEAFVSALKMSWAWRNPVLAPHNSYAPTSDEAMATGKQTLASTMADIRRGSIGTTESTVTSGRNLRLSVTKFLERFAMSSSQLAVQLLGSQDGISRLGVLYDQILTTGWVKLNHSNDTVSKGQLIFLVRRVLSADERNDLLAKHFIFAESQAVASALHKTLSVPFDHTVPLLEDIRVFCDSTLKPTLQSGILYTGVAVVQATPFDGLRILLEQDHRAQLPLRQLCSIGGNNSSSELNGTLEELGEAIGWLEGMSLLSIITRNMTVDSTKPGGERVSKLLVALERAIIPMLDEMLDAEDMQHILPRLSLHPVLVPLTPGGSRKTAKMTGYTPPYAIIFYANYDAAVNTFTDKWLPFSLFRAQNSCVMAPRIAAAAKMDQLYSSQIGTNTTDSMPEYYEYSRRPSKVQFEFPDNVPAPSPTSPVTGGMFTGFSFPPRSDTPAAPSPAATGLTSPGLSLNSWARRNPITPGGGVGGIRRSSLATRSRYDSIDVGSSERGEGLPGVAEWDPDWLLILLRTKLRAEA